MGGIDAGGVTGSRVLHDQQIRLFTQEVKNRANKVGSESSLEESKMPDFFEDMPEYGTMGNMQFNRETSNFAMASSNAVRPLSALDQHHLPTGHQQTTPNS